MTNLAKEIRDAIQLHHGVEDWKNDKGESVAVIIAPPDVLLADIQSVLAAKLPGIVGALEFYANEDNYNEDGAPGNEVNLGPTQIEFELDKGFIAHIALRNLIDEGGDDV